LPAPGIPRIATTPLPPAAVMRSTSASRPTNVAVPGGSEYRTARGAGRGKAVSAWNTFSSSSSAEANVATVSSALRNRDRNSPTGTGSSSTRPGGMPSVSLSRNTSRCSSAAPAALNSSSVYDTSSPGTIEPYWNPISPT